MKRYFIIALLSVFVITAAGDASDKEAPAAPAQAQASQPAPQPLPDKKPAIREFPGPPVNFFFDDADIFEVAQTIFGDILKVNYIIDPRVKGRVNFRTVAPIPRSEALSIMEIIFRLNGIGIVEEGNLYRILPLSETPTELVYSQIGKEPDQVSIELFTFKNLNIRDSLQDIENALGLRLKGGTVRILPIYRLNALLVIASTKTQMDYVRQWIDVFDNMFKGAKPKVYVYPVQNGKAGDVFNLLMQIFFAAAPAKPAAAKTTPTKPATPTTVPGQPAVAPARSAVPSITPAPSGETKLLSDITRIFSDEVTNSIVILAPPEDYQRIAETIKLIDIVPRQVVIEVLIAEITLSGEMRFGIEWSLKTDLKLSGLKPFTRDVDLSGNVGFDSANLDPTKLTGFTFLATDPTGIVRAMLQALAGESRLNVLASPHLLATDNREAKIQIGDQVPIVTSETNITGTTQIQRTIQSKDTGTILKIKPQINESGIVSLELNQEVSDYAIKTLYGSEYPVIFKRETSTTLVVKDGETIVIGGLIRDKNERTREGIPFLSQIPVLGYLFGYTANTDSRTELIVLLTPRVIKSPQDAKNVTSDYLQRFKSVREEIRDERIKEGLNKK
ncbi:MAG: hypothetical protein L0Y62_06970 [Nitrospirae bacterium]|nr:hypothetical protein [Nitrospirota bacterium]